MYVVVQHRVTDPEKFFANDPDEFERNSPPGVQGQQFYPSTDRSSAVCLWEAESLEALRSYIDGATAGAAENTYFEVDTEHAVGLEPSASASA